MAQEDIFQAVSSEDLILFVFFLIFTFILGGLLNILIIKALRDRAKPAVYNFASKSVMYGVYMLGLYYAFSNIINLSLTAGLAGLGILGIALLLPTVPWLQNLMSGIVIAIERPFQEDDIVEVNGVISKVREIRLRTTHFRAIDGQIIIVPNLSFMTGPVINYSKGEFIRAEVKIDIANSADIDKIKDIIHEICSNSPNILPNVPQKNMNKVTKVLELPKNFFKIPRNIKNLSPRVYITSLSKDKVSLEVWYWYWDILQKEQIRSGFYRKLLEQCNKNKIKLG